MNKYANHVSGAELTGMPSLMSGYKVLDLTNSLGYVCGKMLADYGMEVIKIEPPKGDPSMVKAPFIGGVAEGERSIYYNCYNTNKKGITLDIETEKGKEIFKTMVKGADIVIESFEPGYLKKIGLDFDSLHEVNPKMIMISITPFGQHTSRAHWKGGDLICSALGGVCDNIGDPDRAPLRENSDTCVFYGNMAAMTAGMIALYGRETNDGPGQQCDVSIEEAVSCRNFQGGLQWEFNKTVTKRMGPFSKYGVKKVRTIWECQDCFINWTMFAGFLGAKSNAALCQWMTEEGMENPLAVVEDWKVFDLSSVSDEEMVHWEECMAAFFKKRTKAEIAVESPKRRLAATILAGPDDILENEHLNARGYWNSINYEDYGVEIPQTRFFMHGSETENFTTSRAPKPGQDNKEVYASFGIGNLDELKSAGVI